MFGKLGKLARIAALVAALSSACKSRSDRFLELVAKKDKAVAAQLIRDSRKKADYDKVSITLLDLDMLLNYKGFERSVERLPVYSGGGFFYDLLGFFERNFKKTLNTVVGEKVKPLADAGLKETAEEQRGKLVGYFWGLDQVIADEISLETALYRVAIEKKKFENRRNDMDTKEAIRYLQQLLQAARKAGFNQIADACSNALINIRGALVK